MEANQLKIKKYNWLATIVSIIIPIVVAVLFRDQYIKGVDFSFLPPIYASLNAITAVVLVLAFVAIKNKQVKRHENLIKVALGISLLFLIMYVLYHVSTPPTPFGGQGAIKYIYYTLLISHILLSVVIIPFVLFTYIRAITGRIEMHRKLAKITFPLWLYVAVTGVVVYLMIAPYYG
jgi:putative membrane protein